MAVKYFCDRCARELTVPLEQSAEQIPKGERTKAQWLFCRETCMKEWDSLSRDLEAEKKRSAAAYREFVKQRVRLFNEGSANDGIPVEEFEPEDRRT